MSDIHIWDIPIDSTCENGDWYCDEYNSKWICENGEWVEYPNHADCLECTNGDWYCIGTTKYICENNTWVSYQDHVDCQQTPPEIPWLIIGAAVATIGIGGTVAYLLLRRKKQ